MTDFLKYPHFHEYIFIFPWQKGFFDPTVHGEKPESSCYFLMYPVSINIFVSVAWLMVCCRYDSLGRLGHCAPRVVVVGTVHTFLPLAGSLEKAQQQSRLLSPRWSQVGVITHNRHLQSFQDCNPSVYSSGALVLLCPNPWWHHPVWSQTPGINPISIRCCLLRPV